MKKYILMLLAVSGVAIEAKHQLSAAENKELKELHKRVVTVLGAKKAARHDELVRRGVHCNTQRVHKKQARKHAAPKREQKRVKRQARTAVAREVQQQPVI